jgi:hypothetical protein
MYIDILVSQTLARLAGIRAFLTLLDSALPEFEWRENDALEQLAHEEHWDYSDFDLERQALDERFRFWLPRFTAYSNIIFLYSVLETQLAACAERAHQNAGSAFTPADIQGRGIDAAALYLERIGVYDVRQDAEWHRIVDLRDLRNLIVHRVGTKGQSDEQRKTAKRLEVAYSGQLQFPDNGSSWYGEVWISIHLCRNFLTAIEAFFRRVFKAMGLPPSTWTDNEGSLG